jgi:hypothetical protein
MKVLKTDPDYCNVYYNNLNTFVSHTRNDFAKQMEIIDVKRIATIRSYLSTRLLSILKIDNYNLNLINRRGEEKKKN